MKNVYCSVFGHNYKISKNVTYHVKEYTCKHCNIQVTTNGKGGLSQLTPKYKEINSILERIHNRRIEKKQLNNLITDR
jgi:F0F1-type ATP synthase gamma subunit